MSDCRKAFSRWGRYRLGILNATSLAAVALALSACGGGSEQAAPTSEAVLAQGKEIFRFDTFGDETQWTDKLRMHEVIRDAVDPTTALAVGLKVDADALPQ